MDYTNATVAPQPHGVIETLPPSWYWESVQSTVTVRIPVWATPDADPETYRFIATAYNTTGHRHAYGVTTDFSVTVANRSDG